MAKQDRRETVVEAETAPAVASAVPSPPPQVVDVPEYTVRTFASGKLRDPIMKAFISCEERLHNTRKLPMEQWAQLFQAFKGAPR